MSRFEKLSISPGVSVDPNTGEIIDLVTHDSRRSINKKGGFTASKYPQKDIDKAREVTSVMCEQILCSITGGKRAKKGNNQGYDIKLKDGKTIEGKVGRIGSSAVIKKNQLFDFKVDYWGFVFYRTSKNLPPSYFTNKKTLLSPQEYLLRNISIEGAYIFPAKVIKYFWNNDQFKIYTISTTGISHKPFARSKAEGLFLDNEVPGDRREITAQLGRHKFPIRTIDFRV